MDTPPLSYGSVLSLTINNFKRLLPKLIVGAIVFGITMALIQGNFAPNPADSLGDIGALIEAGESDDPAAMADAIAAMQAGGGIDPAMMAGLAGASMLFLLLISAINALATLFYFNVSLGANGSFIDVVKVSLRKLLPYIALMIILGIISFIWVPLLGIVVAIVVMPKLMFSVMILLHENTGVIDSIKQSWKRTNGYWPQIVGYMIVTVIIMVIVSMILAMVIGFIPGGMYLLAIISQLLQAFMVVFTVVMGTLIFAHPKATVATTTPVNTVEQ